MPIIETENLSKEYTVTEKSAGIGGALRSLVVPRRKTVRAVDGVNLQIREGEIVGYLGPNGAGKSTTVKMLSGILAPTSGSIRVNGFDPHTDRRKVVQKLGVVFGQRTQLYWDLRLGESFELLRRIYRIPDESYKRVTSWMETALELKELQDKPVRTLSLGQRMRGEIAAALLHEPEILFLDEPTIGLDIEAKDRIRTFIKEINRERQTTVMLTTHDLDDVERLCERLVIINHGAVVEDGPLSELVQRLAPNRVLQVDFSGSPGTVDLGCAHETRREGNRLWIEFDRSLITASALISRISEQIQILDLSVR